MSTPEPSVAQLEATIAALEAQRPILGDVVVDTAVAPLRQRLAALLAPPPALPPAPSPAVAATPAAEAAAAATPTVPAQELRQVSILFLDVVGSTALSLKLDPEEVHEVMDGALQRCAALVQRHGGKVLQYAGDNLLAAFGADEAREDDAEQSVHCGLAMLSEGRTLGAEVLQQHGHEGFNVRVGVHTGPVLLGGGVSAEGSIRGMAVNVAARMEQTSPPGALRISQDTYRQVRGVFDVEPQPAIQVKGIDEPVLTYLVQRAKPRAFRAGTRGIEGVETRMVGRDRELQLLQQAFVDLHHQRRMAVWMVVSDAGVGKSRLLYEFANWAEVRPEAYLTFQGRAHPRTAGQPFGLLRDVLAWRLQIADTDSVALAKAKIEAGIAPLFEADDGPDLAQAHAHLLGHLVGLDFSDSPHVQGILDDPKQIRTRAFHAGAQAFRRFSLRSGHPIVLQLDDLHWADEGSLDFLNHLLRANRDMPMLVLCLTRPTFYEAHPDWQADNPQVHRIDLSPLDKSTSQQLAVELLKRLPQVPAALSELVIGRTDGNPFYMEEIVKMLIDQGALTIGPDAWTLNPERLLTAAVPTTLTGILQARLDGLPATERTALQQASVVGMVFWEQALAALDRLSPTQLPSLVRRGLTEPRDETRLEGAKEYAFKHQLLHDVTYETLLKRVRRELHAMAAAWFAQATGVRATGLLGAAAEHFEKAGDTDQAVEYFARAAEEARQRFAHESALGFVGKALSLLANDERPGALAQRWRLLDVRERTYELQGRRPDQRADLDALQAVAEALDANDHRAEVAMRRSLLAGRSGDFTAQAQAARDALSLAEGSQDSTLRLNAKRLLAAALARLGQVEAGLALAQQGLAEARALGLIGPESRFLNALAVMSGRQNDLVGVLNFSEQATRLRRVLGDRRNEAIGLSGQGGTWLDLGNFDQARDDLNECLRLHRAMGDRALEPIALANLSQLALWEGNPAGAKGHAEAALAVATDVQAAELRVFALWCLGNAALSQDEIGEAETAFQACLDAALAMSGAQRFDAAAGLARVALSRQDVDGALDALVEVLAHLHTGATLDGTLNRVMVQTTCWHALNAAGDARALPLLTAAHAGLMAYADTIKDPAVRQSFLDRVPPNRELQDTWAHWRPGA